ncbi:altered inheritance of mitochondria protein 31, mitochondrial [Annulohypoxylon maeteangense]|uniref:altered inheritance of mitochondria protein 31, mitochondrial n=1 Tax=Annulohypoxylon maeteangense TaxID=1927788 RepID=UPI002008D3C0|nr:altered inheritance of mitochondria protein 31, mitochondrial [Annulohypoxylon maeteangense]KAI0879805.1 altered inheritance of mitochondria protein 31, mitochondrial [Annulohypoxylon maeteangense]
MTDKSMPSSFDENKDYNETATQKIGRKIREEPLIPLGTLLTTLAVINAWRAMRRGDHAQVQRMFRARVGAQAFTVVAIVAGGAYYGADREKRKELIKLEAQQRAEERHQKWLKELEVRDEEDKQLKAAMKRRQDRVQQRRSEEKEKGKGKGKEKGDSSEAKTSSANADADGQNKKETSNVLGALADVGGWFGTRKSENANITEDKKAEKMAEAETTNN